jgi:hypothetical protein
MRLWPILWYYPSICTSEDLRRLPPEYKLGVLALNYLAHCKMLLWNLCEALTIILKISGIAQDTASIVNLILVSKIYTHNILFFQVT